MATRARTLRLLCTATTAFASQLEGHAAQIIARKQLTLEAADAMATAAISEARAKRFNDISVTVVDTSGRELVAKTQPGCPLLVPHLAKAKAGACVGTHSSSSRALKDKYLPDRQAQLLAMTTIGATQGERFAAVPGGVLCRDADGDVVCAIGVSGATADEDEHCAIIAAQSVGLVTEAVSSIVDK